MSTFRSTNSLQSDGEVVLTYKDFNIELYKNLPALQKNPLEMAIVINSEQFDIKPKSQDNSTSVEGGYLLSCGIFGATESLMTAKKLYGDRKGKDPNLDGKMEDYYAKIRSDEYRMNGTSKIDNSKMDSWDPFWNYLDLDILHERVLRYMGLWDSKEGMDVPQHSHLVGGSNSFDDYIGGKRKDLDGNMSGMTVKRLKYDQTRRLFIKGSQWIVNPLLPNWVEPSKFYTNPYGDNVMNQSRFGLRPFLGGKLTIYWIQHDEYKFIYPQVLCENFYGQLYTVTGNKKYRAFQSIGEIVEIQGDAHVDYVGTLMSIIFPNTSSDTGRNKKKTVEDAFKEWYSQPSKLRVQAHTQ